MTFYDKYIKNQQDSIYNYFLKNKNQVDHIPIDQIPETEYKERELLLDEHSINEKKKKKKNRTYKYGKNYGPKKINNYICTDGSTYIHDSIYKDDSIICRDDDVYYEYTFLFTNNLPNKIQIK